MHKRKCVYVFYNPSDLVGYASLATSLYTREALLGTTLTHLWVASNPCVAGRPIKNALVRSQ